MAEDKGAAKGGAKDSKDAATAGATTQEAQSASQFVTNLSPEQRKALAIALATTDNAPKKPVVRKKFRVVAVRLGFDGLTLRHPGKKFTMEINVNDDWPDWVVKEEDYIAPSKDEDDEDGEEGAQRVQIRGGVKAGNSIVI